MGRNADSARAREAAIQIVRTLREAGHTAYFAGGCVRDELLGLEPTDYDVATDATPDRLQSLFPRTAAVGAAFGVILVRIHKCVVEVATFRADGPYSDRRRPDQITFSDPVADARRRDFTVNALFIDPTADEAHRVIDHVGGLADLERRVIRAVGDPDQRLAEDHLRALRAVRFASRLGFAIEPGTAEAIRRHTLDLDGVSRERIGDELRRMAADAGRAGALAMLQELGLDAPVLGEPAREVPLTLTARLPGRVSFPAALAAWTLDRGLAPGSPGVAEAVARLRVKLCLSNQERDAVAGILGGLVVLETGWEGMTVAARKRAAASGWFGETMLLLRARDAARAADLERAVEALAASPPGLAPAPLLTGDDLVAAGYRPGPAFRPVLEAVYDAQLEGRVNDRAGALELARSLGI